MSRELVAYFSASGTTAAVARDLAAAIDADLYEIRPEQTYTHADLDWNDGLSRSSLEMGDESARPGISGAVDGMERYDTVYIGFPVWWYVEPRIIDTFLQSYDFAGKTIIPFATSGGSGLGRAPRRMQELAVHAKVKQGGLLNRRPARDQLREWAVASKG